MGSKSRSRRFINRNEADLNVVMIEEIRKTGEGLDPDKVERMLELREIENQGQAEVSKWQDNFNKKGERPKQQIVVKSMKYSKSMLKTLMQDNIQQNMIQKQLSLYLGDRGSQTEENNIDNNDNNDNNNDNNEENEEDKDQEIENQYQKYYDVSDEESELLLNEEKDLSFETEESDIHQPKDLGEYQQLQEEEEEEEPNEENQKTSEPQEDSHPKPHNLIIPEIINKETQNDVETKQTSETPQINNIEDPATENIEDPENPENKSQSTETPIQEPTPTNQEEPNFNKEETQNLQIADPDTNPPNQNRTDSSSDINSHTPQVVLGVLFLDGEYGFMGDWNLEQQVKILSKSEIETEDAKFQKIEEEEELNRAISDDQKSNIAVSVKGADKHVQRQIKHRKKTSKRLDYYPQGGVFVLAKKKHEVIKQDKEVDAEEQPKKISTKSFNSKKLSKPKVSKAFKHKKHNNHNHNHKMNKSHQKSSSKNQNSKLYTSGRHNKKHKLKETPEDLEIEISKTPALLKFKSRKKRAGRATNRSKSDFNASRSNISDFDQNHPFAVDHNTSGKQTRQKVSQLEVDINKALDKTHKIRRSSTEIRTPNRGYDSEGEDFPPQSYFQKNDRLSQTLQIGQESEQKYRSQITNSKTKQEKIRKRRKYASGAVVSKQKKRKRFAKNKEAGAKKLRKSRVEKDKQSKKLAETKLVPKVKIEIVKKKDPQEIRQELRDNNKKVLLAQEKEQAVEFSDPRTKHFMDKIESKFMGLDLFNLLIFLLFIISKLS